MTEIRSVASDQQSYQIFFAIGALSAAVSVIAGAFGAHALRGSVDPEMLAAFETAVRYQMYHALAIVAAALAGEQWGNGNARKFRAAGFLFILGTLLFSGSLYTMVLTGARWFGAITPIGGLLFIAGWLVLVWAGWSAVSQKSPFGASK